MKFSLLGYLFLYNKKKYVSFNCLEKEIYINDYIIKNIKNDHKIYKGDYKKKIILNKKNIHKNNELILNYAKNMDYEVFYYEGDNDFSYIIINNESQIKTFNKEIKKNEILKFLDKIIIIRNEDDLNNFKKNYLGKNFNFILSLIPNKYEYKLKKDYFDESFEENLNELENYYFNLKNKLMRNDIKFVLFKNIKESKLFNIGDWDIGQLYYLKKYNNDEILECNLKLNNKYFIIEKFNKIKNWNSDLYINELINPLANKFINKIDSVNSFQLLKNKIKNNETIYFVNKDLFDYNNKKLFKSCINKKFYYKNSLFIIDNPDIISYIENQLKTKLDLNNNLFIKLENNNFFYFKGGDYKKMNDFINNNINNEYFNKIKVPHYLNKNNFEDLNKNKNDFFLILYIKDEDNQLINSFEKMNRYIQDIKEIIFENYNKKDYYNEEKIKRLIFKKYETYFDKNLDIIKNLIPIIIFDDKKDNQIEIINKNQVLGNLNFKYQNLDEWFLFKKYLRFIINI